MIKSQLDIDLKTALLSKDTQTTMVLRALKSAVLYAEVAAKKRETGLSEDEIIAVLHKESKKRQESADLYVQAASSDRAELELQEKAIIDKYLPAQLGEAEITAIVERTIASFENPTMQVMGQIIGAVKQKAGATADGGLIAKIVKERLLKA